MRAVLVPGLPGRAGAKIRGGRVRAAIPRGARAFCLHLFGERGPAQGSEHVERN